MEKVTDLAVYMVGIFCARAVCTSDLLCCDNSERLTIKMQITLIAAALFATVQCKPALIYTHQLQPAGIEYAPTAVPQVQPHPAVEMNAASEAKLPRELLKSADFYENPSVAAGLAKESWFANKEMQVVEREAEKIPRESIYKIVKNAGFLDAH